MAIVNVFTGIKQENEPVIGSELIAVMATGNGSTVVESDQPVTDFSTLAFGRALSNAHGSSRRAKWAINNKHNRNFSVAVDPEYSSGVAGKLRAALLKNGIVR